MYFIPSQWEEELELIAQFVPPNHDLKPKSSDVGIGVEFDLGNNWTLSVYESGGSEYLHLKDDEASTREALYYVSLDDLVYLLREYSEYWLNAIIEGETAASEDVVVNEIQDQQEIAA